MLCPMAQRHQAPFVGFFERDALRQDRRRGRRRTVIVSLAIHGVVLGALVGYSVWHVDELWGPSVKVKVFAPAAAPAEAR